MNHEEMRKLNSAHILRTIYRLRRTNVATLQRESGLSRGTIESILKDLIADSWVATHKPAFTSDKPVGRPGKLYEFCDSRGFVVAFELQRGQIRVTVADLALNVFAQTRVGFSAALRPLERITLVESTVSRLLCRAEVNQSSVLAVTASVAAVVRDDGTLDPQTVPPEWADISPLSLLASLFECPIRVENGAHLAALGERSVRDEASWNLAYLQVDSEGIAVGLAIRSGIYRGLDGAAGALRPLLFEGRRTSFAALGLDHAEAVTDVRFVPRIPGQISHLAAVVVPYLLAIDALVSPEEVVLGGRLAPIADVLIPAVQVTLAQSNDALVASLRAPQLGDRSVLRGCLAASIESVLNRQLELPLPAPDVKAEGPE